MLRYDRENSDRGEPRNRSSGHMICKEWQRRICFSLSLPFLPLLHSPESLAADVLGPNATEQVKAILADQVREQGNACDKAEEAHRDAAVSKPDEPVWILKCSNAVYRIRLRGNMAATVEVVDSYP
jgi:hypothetical protein